MRLKTILLAAVGLTLVVILAAVLALRSLDFNRYKGLIAEGVKAATGRELTIGGSLALKLGLSPAVVAENVSLANAPWGSRPEMAKIRRFEVEVALLPLIAREIHVTRVVLVQPDILLETDAGGMGNWSFGAPPSPAPSAPKTGESSAGLATLAVERVRIEKGTLTYRDARTRRTMVLALDRLDLRAKDAASPLAIDLAAGYQGKAFTLAGSLGPLRELVAPSRPYPIKLSLRAGGARLEAEGAVAKPMEAAGLDLKVTAKGEELAEVIGLTGRRIPALGPFTLRAQVTGSPRSLSVSGIDASVGKAEQVLVSAKGSVKDVRSAKGIRLGLRIESRDPRPAAQALGLGIPAVPPISAAARVADAGEGYAFDEVKITMGASNLAGSGTVTLAGPRPKVKARLASVLLDFAELLRGQEKTRTGPSPQPVAGSGPGKRVFPADPFSLDGLKRVDAELELTADRLVLPNRLAVEALATHLALLSGRLRIEPLSSRIAGGALTGSIDLDASAGGGASLAAKVDARAVDLGQMLRQMGHPDLVAGTRTDLALSVRARGGSLRELMAGLTGDARLVLGEGKIHARLLDWLGADLLTQIAERVNPLRQTDPYTELRCGVIRFVAKDGIASSDKGIAFETDKMTLVSSGTVDLTTEAIDFSLRPDTRQGIGIGAGELVKLLRVRGTLAEPKFRLDEVETAKRAASIGAAVATAGVSFLAETLARRALADPQPCQTALAKTSGPAQTGAAPSTAAPRSGSGIGQFFRGLFGR